MAGNRILACRVTTNDAQAAPAKVQVMGGRQGIACAMMQRLWHG
jgi:hypothetical protein